MSKFTPEFTQPQLPFNEIPYGYCQCGCGRKTNVYKGAPRNYCHGHNGRTHEAGANPSGLCMCGCGEKTNLAPYTFRKTGWVKGQPICYINGHSCRKLVGDVGPNPSGLCECGCGQKTKLAPQTQLSKGWVRGQPIRFIAGHNEYFYASISEAFWSRCDRGGPDECWLWTGTKTSGYGCFRYSGKLYSTHRFSYELHHGLIPEGLDVLHNCPGGDNPLCCNWAHLFLGTQADNNADMMAKGRHVAARGEQHGCAKLTETEVLEIRRMYKEGVNRHVIARQYDIAKTYVNSIVRRRSWKHI